jgi:hypothetical protein
LLQASLTPSRVVTPKPTLGKTVPTTANFPVVAANAAIDAKFAAPDHFPLTTDPQHPDGSQTLSVFRRPFVNTNVNFEAALLWDGRESISNLIGEVSDSQKAVLLGAGTDATVNNALANFLSGVFTDQKSSDVAGGGGAPLRPRPMISVVPSERVSLLSLSSLGFLMLRDRVTLTVVALEARRQTAQSNSAS